MATNKNYVEEHWRVCVTKNLQHHVPPSPPDLRTPALARRPCVGPQYVASARREVAFPFATNTLRCGSAYHGGLPPTNQPTNRGWRTLSITRVFHAARCLEAAKLRRYCAAVSDHIFHARRNRKEMKRRERERIREYITRYTIAWSRVDVDLYT